MKNRRIIFLVSLLVCLSLGGRVFAQSALKIYECEVLPLQEHVFSESAKVFAFNNNGDSIFRLWIKTDGTTEQMSPLDKSQYPYPEPAAQTGNASLPGDGFYFGDKKMKYFGLTGGGLVYFGETDELHPTYAPAANVNQDYVAINFFAGTAPTPLNTSPYQTTWILATETTSVKYEFSATEDTLFIAYDNVKVLDTGNRAFVLSFQYAFTKDGEVFFTPVDMQPQGEPDLTKAQNVFYFNYGLFAKKAWNEVCYLKDLNGTVASGGLSEIRITKETYPNQTYRMHPPAPCQPVENPVITWACTAATDYIELTNNVMTCNEGQSCLFIVSEKSSLSGDDLPQDGREYNTGDKIGSSLLVVKANVSNGKLWLGGKAAEYTVTGLTSGTTYYIYAFPYLTDCAGVSYNTTNIPTRAVTTAILPVNTVSVDAASMTDNGFTLNIDKGNAERYILAVSHRQISPYIKTILSSKEGGYKVGDKLKFLYRSASTEENYELEILAVASADAQYNVTDAQPNTEYYYYVWSTDASQSKFSFETRTCGVSFYRTPAILSFDSAAAATANLEPAGWTLPVHENRSFRVVDEEGKFLSVGLLPTESETGTVDLRAEAVSPRIQGGKTVSASVDFYFWKIPSGSIEPTGASLRAGDTIYIQYKGVSENTWKALSTVTAANATAGNNTVDIPSIYSSEDFNFRFVAVSTVAAGEDGYANAAIREIRVESICRSISSEPEVSQIMSDRVVLSWDDEDNTPRAAAYHLRYRLSENEAWTGRISKNRSYTFTGLKANTFHTIEVAAVCAAGDTSDYVDVSFTTLRGLPYEFVLASKEGSQNPDTLPEGVTLKTGALPVGGTASLTEPDMEKTVWTPVQKGTAVYAGLEVSASLNNPLWLNLPVLSSGMSRGKARLSLKLSAWDASEQQATFSQNDTLLVLFSTNNTFNRSNTKLQVDLNEVTLQGNTFNIDFDVENSYLYWAIYTNLQTAGNVLFIDSLHIEWTELYCNAATGLRQSNLDKRSVDISWTGEGEEYGIFYNDRNTDKWDTVYTHETTYTLDNLLPETPYQYYIVVYCDADRIKQSDRSTTRYFQTEMECEVPTLEVVEGSETWQGVTVITKSNVQTREFYVEPQDHTDCSEHYTASNGKKDTVNISGLVYCGGIPYFIKARSLCPRDTSDWSEVKEFTTLPRPECGVPTNLKAEVNAAAKTATLSWTAGVNNLAWTVFYRVGNALRGDTASVDFPTFTINTLVPDVVYTWSLMAACEKPLYSAEVKGNSFGTNVGVESVQGFDKSVKVRVFENQLIIENNEGFYIKSLQAFSTDGKLLKTYPVNSAQNAYIYHSLPKGAALLRILGENGKTATYKTVIL